MTLVSPVNEFCFPFLAAGVSEFELAPVLCCFTPNHRLFRMPKALQPLPGRAIRLPVSSSFRRKKKKYERSTPQQVAENLLNRKFQAEAPNKKWVTDVAEFKYGDGQKAYLSDILDLQIDCFSCIQQSACL